MKEAKREYYLELLEWLREWVKPKMKPFSADDVKEEYLKNHEPAIDERVFGNALQTIWREGITKQAGEVTTKSKKAHGRKIKVWITISYSEKQSINRKANGANQQTLF